MSAGLGCCGLGWTPTLSVTTAPLKAAYTHMQSDINEPYPAEENLRQRWKSRVGGQQKFTRHLLPDSRHRLGPAVQQKIDKSDGDLYSKRESTDVLLATDEVVAIRHQPSVARLGRRSVVQPLIIVVSSTGATGEDGGTSPTSISWGSGQNPTAKIRRMYRVARKLANFYARLITYNRKVCQIFGPPCTFSICFVQLCLTWQRKMA